MVEFADLQCPFCAEYHARVFPDAPRSLRAHRQAADRAAAAALPRSGFGPPGARGVRCGGAGPDVAVRRARLRPSGPRELGLRHRRLHQEPARGCRGPAAPTPAPLRSQSYAARSRPPARSASTRRPRSSSVQPAARWPASSPASSPRGHSWRASRRSSPVKRAIAAVALLGLAISAYLTWVHYAGIEPVCTGISDCERVQTSVLRRTGGDPGRGAGRRGLRGAAAVAPRAGRVDRAARLPRGRVQRLPDLGRAVPDRRHLPVVRRERALPRWR